MNASNLNTVIANIVAEDRPGIMRTLSDLAFSHNANWQKINLSRLLGQCTGTVHFEVAKDKSAALEAALTELSKQGIHVTVTLIY